MKIYYIEEMDKPNPYGEIKFEWTDTSEQSTKVCIQQKGQPAVFFEELLRGNGYRKVEEKQVSAWDDNSIQFPRLIAEIMANGVTEELWDNLLESMDLESDELSELFDRAQTEWEKIKADMFEQKVDDEQETKPA